MYLAYTTCFKAMTTITNILFIVDPWVIVAPPPNYFSLLNGYPVAYTVALFLILLHKLQY